MVFNNKIMIPGIHNYFQVHNFIKTFPKYWHSKTWNIDVCEMIMKGRNNCSVIITKLQVNFNLWHLLLIQNNHKQHSLLELLFTISSSLWIIISTNNVGNPLPSPSQIDGHISSIGKNHTIACHSRLPLTPIHQMQYIFPTIMLNNGWSNYHPPLGPVSQGPYELIIQIL